MPLSEFDIIKRYFSPSYQHHPMTIKNGDDAAAYPIPESRQMVQCLDTLVENQHFFADTPPHAIGYKALAVNISDLAAMGATPHSVLLGLTLPSVDESWLSAFSSGFLQCAERFSIDLIGGDITQGPLTISVCANGLLPKGQGLTRGGARVGDLIYVTGTLGCARYAVETLNNNQTIPEAIQHRLDYPTPRMDIAGDLLNIASACIDLSDGLAADLQKMLQASQIGARIRSDLLPIAPLLRQQPMSLPVEQYALNGGDDYELCFCLPKQKIPLLYKLQEKIDYPITQIGVITDSHELAIVDGHQNAVQLVFKGYDHFKPNQN